MRKLKKIPRFKSEAEEIEFWATHDSTEYVDYSLKLATFGSVPNGANLSAYSNPVITRALCLSFHGLTGEDLPPENSATCN
jgi:hypothetical protein